MAKNSLAYITQEHVSKACEMISGGKSLRDACRALNISESSMRYHLMKDEQAFAQSTHARELGCDALADQCLEIADDQTLDPAHKRIMVETRIRLIGKWSQRYSDKVTVKNETTVTHRYDLDRLGSERLEELERILADAAGSESGAGETQPSSLH
jgi:hypothetical protein